MSSHRDLPAAGRYDEIAGRFLIRAMDIKKLLDAGEHLDLEYLKLPHDRFTAMQAAFAECGTERLKPAFEYLQGQYTYEELRLARVLLGM